jgi:hypothetical protein
MRIRLHGEYQPRQPGFVTNPLLRVILQVELGGHTFNVYGSMSWTMSEVAKLPWSVIHSAYIELTGDKSDEVNNDLATRVVQNALQEAWALYSQRDDIVGRVASHHEMDAMRAVTHLTAVPTTQEQQMEPDEINNNEDPQANEADAPSTPAPAAAEGRTEKTVKVPTRGAMGRMHELLKQGIQSEEEILRVLTNEYPSAKQLQRNLRYVARIAGFTLKKMDKVVDDATEAPAPEA